MNGHQNRPWKVTSQEIFPGQGEIPKPLEDMKVRNLFMIGQFHLQPHPSSLPIKGIHRKIDRAVAGEKCPAEE